jgi:hypothetical protein
MHAGAAGPRRPLLHPLRSIDPAALSAAKQRARFGASLSSPMTTMAAPAHTHAVVSGGLNQPGLIATDNSVSNDGTPPDPTGAVGPSHYVEFVNSVIRVYSKSDLSPVGSPVQLDDFVGASGDAVFDPQIQWDQQGNRWFYLADDCSNSACTGTNSLAYGYSKTPDPSDLASGWCHYSIRTDNKGGVGLFDDYPKLGHNNSHLIFGTNVFNATGDFVSSRIWTVAKPSPSATTCATAPGPTAHYWSGPASAPVPDAALLATQTLKNQDGTAAGTPVPANTADSSVNGYVVAARDPFSASKIMAWHVDGTGALVADGDIAVSAYSAPAAVPQPGTTDELDSLDERLTQAVAHADPDAGGAEAVWTQHTINGPGGRSVDRWYELLPAAKAKRQEGNVSDPSSFVFNGAISPTMSGNEAVIQYNVAGGNQLAQIWAQSRKSAQPLNAMSTPVKLGDSTHFDQDFSCPSVPNFPPNTVCRWGDYSGATPDPAASTGQPDGPEHRVWGTNQLLGNPRGGDPSAPHWITRNFALVPERLAPTASMIASPQTATRITSVTFNGSASRDTELPGGIASYAWDFDGDGTTDQTTTAPTTTHTYSGVGTFNARLVVTDSDDGLASVPATQTVTVQNIGPTASLAASTAKRVAGVRTTLSAAASQDPDGSIVNYRWDLDGNGTFETNTGATPTANRTFPRFGTFRVGLQVTDSDGAINATTASLAVSPAPMKLSLTFARKVKLKTLLARGLNGKVGCRHSCKVTLVVSVPRKVARKLGTKTTLIRRVIRITGTRPKRVKLALGKKAKAALGRANPTSLAVTLRGTATVKTSRTSRAKRTLRVVR